MHLSDSAEVTRSTEGEEKKDWEGESEREREGSGKVLLLLGIEAVVCVILYWVCLGNTRRVTWGSVCCACPPVSPCY